MENKIIEATDEIQAFEEICKDKELIRQFIETKLRTIALYAELEEMDKQKALQP